MIDPANKVVEASSLGRELEQRGKFAAAEARRIIELATLRLSDLHAGGRIHRGLTAATIGRDAIGGIEIAPPPEMPAWLHDAELCPPELHDCLPLEIPTSWSEAAALLAGCGKHLSPGRIDVYQLGVLALRLCSDAGVQDYLHRPSAAAGIPPALRTVIDHAVGVSARARWTTCDQLLAGLRAAATADDFTQPDTPAQSNMASGESTSLGTPATARVRGTGNALPFHRLGVYTIVDRLGSGGMGDVFLGYDAALSRHVAIKVLPAELARHDEFVSRFKTEAAAAAKVEHPNIVPIYSIAEDQGVHFFAMKYVEGESLSHYLMRDRRPPLDIVLRVTRQVLEALQAAHRKGLVHRDIKPGNILLEEHPPRALLADFGLVKTISESAGMTATGVVLGTADYIAPEQGRGLPVDHRADLYAVGILCYQMLSGTLPFSADTTAAKIFQHAYEPPPPLAGRAPDVPAPLAEIVHRLLAKSPDDRFQSAEEVLRALAAVPLGDAITTPGRTRESGSQLSVIAAVEFPSSPTDEALALPAGDTPLAGMQRLLHWVRPAAPPPVAVLENTEHQVDAAVAEYAQRCEKLGRLVHEAEAVLLAFQQQLSSHRTAAAAAEAEAASADDPQQLAEAVAQQQYNEQAARNLERQMLEQREQLDAMRQSLSAFTATLAKLRTQRDLLRARLQAAQVRLGDRAPQPAVRPRTTGSRGLAVAVACAAVLAALAITTVWLWKQPESTPSATAMVNSDGQGESTGAKSQASSSVASGPSSPEDDPGFLKQDGNSLFSPYRVTALTLLSGQARLPNVNLAVGDDLGGVYSLSALPRQVLVRKVAALDGPVGTLARDAEGERLAVAKEQGEELHILSLSPNRELRRLQVDGSIEAAAFAPNDKLLLVGTIGGMHLWDYMAEREIHLPRGGSNAGHISWMPDSSGFLIASRTRGGESVRMYSLGVERPPTSMSMLKSPAQYVALARNGAVAVGLAYKSIWLWDVSTGSMQRQFGENVTAAAATPLGNLLLLGFANGELAVWDTFRGVALRRLTLFDSPVTHCDISSDGVVGAAAAGQQIRFFELPAEPVPGQKRWTAVRKPVLGLSFSRADSALVVTTTRNVQLWPLVPNDRRPVELADAGGGASAVFSPDGQRILFASTNISGGTSFVLRGRTFLEGRELRRYAGHAGEAAGARFLGGGERFISAGADGLLQIWNTATEELLEKRELSEPARCLAVADDGQRALTVGTKPEIEVWNIGKLERVGTLSGHTLLVRALDVTPDGRWGVSAGGDGIRIWDVPQQRVTNVLGADLAPTNSVAISPDGEFVYSAGDDGVVRQWRVSDGTVLRAFAGHVGPALAVALSPDGNLVASGGQDGTVRLWDNSVRSNR